MWPNSVTNVKKAIGHVLCLNAKHFYLYPTGRILFQLRFSERIPWLLNTKRSSFSLLTGTIISIDVLPEKPPLSIFHYFINVLTDNARRRTFVTVKTRDNKSTEYDIWECCDWTTTLLYCWQSVIYLQIKVIRIELLPPAIKTPSVLSIWCLVFAETPHQINCRLRRRRNTRYLLVGSSCVPTVLFPRTICPRGRRLMSNFPFPGFANLTALR